MVSLFSVLVRAIGEHNPIPRGQQILTYQQHVGSGGQFTARHLLTLSHQRQPVKKSHVLLCRNTVVQVETELIIQRSTNSQEHLKIK